MPDLLIIEWDHDRVIAAEGTTVGRKVAIRHAVAVPRNEGESPEELGGRLAPALKEAGITASEATVLLPRELSTFHRVEVPDLSDDELPDVVRLQAATRLTVPLETVALDFAPLPVSAESEKREVILVTAPLRYVDDARACLNVCGLQLSSMRISSFGISAAAVYAGLVPSSTDPDTLQAVVTLRSDSIEMLLMNGPFVEFSHSGASWSSIDGVEQAVRAEISRARMAASEALKAYRVSQLTLIGDPVITAAVPDSITARLNNAPMERIDPADRLIAADLPEGMTASDLVPAAGAIVNTLQKEIPSVDLVNPRKAPEKKDYSRLQRIAAIGITALVLTGAWKWRTSKVEAIEQQVAQLDQKSDEIMDAWDMAKKNELILATRLKDWQDRDLSWLDEMNRLQQIMKDTTRLYVRRFKFTVSSNKRLGLIEAQGYAKSRRDIEDLMRALTENGYEVSPTGISTSARDPEYPMELLLEISIPVNRSQSSERANKES